MAATQSACDREKDAWDREVARNPPQGPTVFRTMKVHGLDAKAPVLMKQISAAARVAKRDEQECDAEALAIVADFFSDAKLGSLMSKSTACRIHGKREEDDVDTRNFIRKLNHILHRSACAALIIDAHYR